MSKFIKQQIKSLDTADRVESILVFDSGNNSPRRVSKSLYEASITNTAARGGYKSYVALLSQTGTNAPEAIVLYNDLGGDVVWSYDALGSYLATLTGAFTINKTVLFTGQNYFNVGNEITYAYPNDENGFYVETIDNGTNVNGTLIGTPIEVRVYP